MNIFTDLFAKPKKTIAFYSHLIRLDSISAKIDKKHLTGSQKDHLKSLAHRAIHHSIIDSVLTEFTLEEKRNFFMLLNQNDHESLKKIVMEKNLEQKIKDTFRTIEKAILLDLI